jgi:uncharacterized protein YjiK
VLRLILGIFLLLALPAAMGIQKQPGQDESGYFREARVLETARLGIQNPVGVAFLPAAETFLVMPARSSVKAEIGAADIAMITSVRQWVGSVRMRGAIADPINMAFDAKTNRLYLFAARTNELIELEPGADGYPDPATTRRIDAGRFGLQNPRGMTVDPATGRLFFLDGALLWVVRIEPDPSQGAGGAAALGNGWISYIELEPLSRVELRGIAFNPANGHLYLLSPAEKKLYEITEAGEIVSVRDLSSLDLADPQGMVFAPSGDRTDDPGTMSLYIADSGLDASHSASKGEGDIIELSLTPPPQLSMVEGGNPATLVNTIDTSLLSPPSPDPSGIAYLPASETLLICDSEVDELSIFTGDNLFEMTRSGALIDTSRTTAFSNEPTGVALRSGNGHFFFTDDDTFMIYEVDPGVDGFFATADDVVTSLSTGSFGSFDTEDVIYDSQQGVLFSVDGDNAEAYRIDPGANGIFDGVSPAGDDQVTHFDTAILGVIEPEGITFDPQTGHLLILGQKPAQLSEVTVDGTLLRTIDLSAVPFVAPGGLAVAPGSLDPAARHLYITDQGFDSNSGSIKNDGKVYEMAVPPLTPGNEPPSVDAGSDQTISLTENAVLDGTVADDGLPDPPGAVSTNWSQSDGPGTVTFADATAVDTTANFTEGGTYVLQLSADDGELTASDTMTVFVSDGGSGGGFVTEVRVAAGTDDAEEKSNGSITLTSTDLEMTFDTSEQIVGMRFNGLDIPQGATIESAYIQFQVDEATSGTTSLTIQGESRDYAATFTTATGNISARPRTAAMVSWLPEPWLAVGEARFDQRTPDIASVIQEIVDRPGWTTGNSLAIIVTGSGERVAESYNGTSAGAPLLHVHWSGGAPSQPPVVSSFAPSGGEPESVVTVTGTNFSGTSGVSINGTPTDFLVVSGTELQAIVPIGAASGPISVTSSAGTGSSADDFAVVASSMVLVGAGNISGCTYDEDEATATLLDAIPGIVFTLGDNAYEDGTAEEYANCYDPTWGRHKARTRPAAGNHDWDSTGAPGYFDYFGVAAGERDKGYYSYDIGAWHFIVLNSNCSDVGGCKTSSPQGQWLQADLAANQSVCTLAMDHAPRFSSGDLGNQVALQDFWEILYAAGADIVLSGHDHHYERFAPQDPNGIADPNGIRQFVVGTGGRGLTVLNATQPNSEVRNNETHGVLKLNLHPTGYDWAFVPIAGKTFTDSGSASCSGAPDTTAPTVTAFDLPAAYNSLIVPISTFTATDDFGVTGYLATESANVPAVDDPGWSASVPTEYTFATEGNKILYGWAKDATGNVSTSLSDTVDITLPDTTAPTVTAFDLPAAYNSLIVPISTFTATDDVGVTGYLATESASAPASDDPGWSASVPTDYTFATEGTKTLYGWAKDTAGNVSASLSDTVTISLSGGGNTFFSDVRTQAGFDDAEEQPSGRVSLTSGDLELIRDKDDQTVGMRFNGVAVPRGATILDAYVQFKVQKATSVATSLLVQGEASDHAAAFVNESQNISSRPRTAAVVSWSPPPWLTVGDAGPDQRTSDITAVIQEVVGRPGWASGNALAIIVTGSGQRVAESYNGDAAGAPLLHVAWSVIPDTNAPTVTGFDLPATSSSLTVPITAFTGTDDVAVTGYLATESAAAPAAGDAGWSATAPTEYTFASEGTQVLYGWAKDAAGNVSTGLSDTVEISLADTQAPTVTAFDLPPTYNALTVPIPTFTATDDVGVTGYLTAESATAPSAGDAGWSATAPTEYTFASEGTQVLYGWAKDAAGNVSTGLSDTVTVSLSGGGGTFVSEVRVATGFDDAEEQPSGSVSLTSGDLELIRDTQDQIVGIRFNGVDIPRGATILKAYVEFMVQKATSLETSLIVQGEESDNAAVFSSSSQNISSRPRTAAEVAWSPPPWRTVGEAGPDQRTSDIAVLIQEIVDRPGWANGNALAIIFTGSGRRVADSYNGNPTGAPLLHVEYR